MTFGLIRQSSSAVREHSPAEQGLRLGPKSLYYKLLHVREHSPAEQGLRRMGLEGQLPVWA